MIAPDSRKLASTPLNALIVSWPPNLPGALAFSSGRAIERPTLQIRHGTQARVSATRQALDHRFRRNRSARPGACTAALEGAQAWQR